MLPGILNYKDDEFEKMKKWNRSMLNKQHISSGETGPGNLTKELIKERKKDIWYKNEILDYRLYHSLSISLKGGNSGKSPMVIHYHNKRTKVIK